jgi:cell division protein FtsL
LTKAANIYWDSKPTSRPRRVAVRRRVKPQAKPRRTTPFWLSFSIVTSMFVMLAITINYRSFGEVREEATQNTRLASQIENLMDENLALQEEIHSLKTDPGSIAREAKRIGMNLKGEKVSVPAN